MLTILITGVLLDPSGQGHGDEEIDHSPLAILFLALVFVLAAMKIEFDFGRDLSHISLRIPVEERGKAETVHRVSILITTGRGD